MAKETDVRIISRASIYEVEIITSETHSNSGFSQTRTIVRVLADGQGCLQLLQEFDGCKHDQANVEIAIEHVRQLISEKKEELRKLRE